MDKHKELREGLARLKAVTGELRGPEAQVEALLAERDALRVALQESDNQLREVLASITDERVHHDGDEFHLALAANKAALSL